jgi:hypothetical protein
MSAIQSELQGDLELFCEHLREFVKTKQSDLSKIVYGDNVITLLKDGTSLTLSITWLKQCCDQIGAILSVAPKVFQSTKGYSLLISELQQLQLTAKEHESLLYKNWFVLYDKNSFQEIHTHGDSLFTSVYFVKTLKNKNLYEGNLVITDTKSNYFGLRTETIIPEEGLIVTFPANYPHYVLPVVQDDTRAVIVNDMYISRL